MLLEANTRLYGTLGVALSKLPDTGEIALIGGLPFKGLELKEFCKGLDEFVSKAEEWRETVENFRPAAEEAAVRDEEEAQILKLVVDHTQKVHPDVIEQAEQNADKPIVFTEL